jgi:tetratricopeptide (TPR) repeat protein
MRIDRYEVDGEVGRGGSGLVFKARGDRGELVAIKLLKAADEEGAARLERELRLLGQLGADQGFVAILGSGRVEGRPYIVMPFVPGGTLRGKLADGPLGVAETHRLGRALARALARAHELGIVHRDLKPENVLFDERGAPLVADLGLAKHFRRDVAGASRSNDFTATGAFFGTPAYMAAEQMEDAKRATPACDVFSLGAILWECLAGRLHFEAPTRLDTIERVLDGKVRPVRTFRHDVPPALARAIEAALSRDPKARPADGRALLRALEATEPGRRNLPLVVGALLALVVAGLFVTFATRGAVAPPAPATPSPGARLTAEIASIQSFLRVGRKDEARERAAKLVRDHPRSALARCLLAEALSMSEEQLDQARQEAEEALALDRELARAWGIRAYVRAMDVDQAGALADAEEALRRDPRDTRALRARALIHYHRHELEAAESDLEEALAVSEEKATLSFLAGVELTLGKPEKVLQRDDRLIALAPRLATPYASRARAKMDLGDHEGALADARLALERDPHNGAASGVERDELLRVGRREEALGAADAALAASEEDYNDWLGRGWVRHLLGDERGALADADHALDLAPDQPRVLRLRAIVRLKLGDLAGARDDARRYSERAPGNPDVDELLRATGLK